MTRRAGDVNQTPQSVTRLNILAGDVITAEEIMFKYVNRMSNLVLPAHICKWQNYEYRERLCMRWATPFRTNIICPRRMEIVEITIITLSHLYI